MAYPAGLHHEIFPLGSSWDDSIVAALIDSHAVVVLVSDHSINSRHVKTEVVRASAENKQIYPVRLIDIEITGGLQFHLELSQWVDFFPNPTSETYDRLAEAIAAGKELDGSTIRRRFDPRRWAALILLGVAGLITVPIAGVYSYEAIQERDMMRQVEEQQREIEERNALREIEMSAEARKRLDVNPRFRFDDRGLYLVSMSVSYPPGDDDSYRIQMIVNNGPPKNLSVGLQDGPVLIDNERLDQVAFRIIELKGDTIKDIDATDEARAVMQWARDQFVGSISSIASDSKRGCRVGGCQFADHRFHLCNPAVKSVRLERDGKIYRIPQSHCRDDASVGQQYCVSARDVPFQMVPGQQLLMVYELLDATEVPVELTVVDRPVVSADSPFQSIAPADVQESPDVPPTFVATYDQNGVTVGGFEFFFEWNECSATGQLVPPARLFVDLDGLGFVPLADTADFRILFRQGQASGQSHPDPALTLPSGPQTIRIGVGTQQGIEAGPWSYDFDPARVIDTAKRSADLPEISCTGDSGFNAIAGHMALPGPVCIAASPYSFFDVQGVEFGREQGLFDRRFEVDYDAEDYMAATCDIRNAECPPVLFQIPDDWPLVFSRIVLDDDSIIAERRHTYQKLAP